MKIRLCEMVSCFSKFTENIQILNSKRESGRISSRASIFR